MNNIPSFKANLIQNPINNQHPAPSVEELLTNDGGQQAAQPVMPKNHHYALKTLGGLAVLTALGVTGRRGGLGKSVQKFLGGKPKLTPEEIQKQIQEKIQNKLNEYISRTENTIFDMKELPNGTTSARRNLANGKEEIILFNQTDGQPKMRVLLEKSGENKTLNYTSYKGADILDDGFDTNAFFKKYSSTGINRNGRFGQKYSNSKIEYGEMTRDDNLSTIQRTTTYYKDGKIDRIIEQDNTNPNFIVRDMLYDKNKNIKGLELVDKNGTMTRKIQGEAPVTIDKLNRKTGRWQDFLEKFSMQKHNTIDI